MTFWSQPDWRLLYFGASYRRWVKETDPTELSLTAVRFWARQVTRHGPPLGVEVGDESFVDWAGDEGNTTIVYVPVGFEELIIIASIG